MWGAWTLLSLTLLLVCPWQVHNVAFAFELMLDGGLKKPKARPEGNTHQSNSKHKERDSRGQGPRQPARPVDRRQASFCYVWGNRACSSWSLSSSVNAVSFCRCGELGPQVHSASPLHAVHQVQGCGVTEQLILQGQVLGKKNGCIHPPSLLSQETSPQGGLRLPRPSCVMPLLSAPCLAWF